MKETSYQKFMLMLIISFCIMYAVMFMNVDAGDHIYVSLTRSYMSLMMVSPMAILMILMMPKMYPSKRINVVIIISGLLVFAVSLTFLRFQSFVSDEQYIKAMIPHHSSAIMTSKHADLKDPEVKKLSEGIIESQEKEIQQMKDILARMKN